MYLELKMQEYMRDESMFENLSSKVWWQSERRHLSFYKLNDNRECQSDVFGA